MLIKPALTLDDRYRYLLGLQTQQQVQKTLKIIQSDIVLQKLRLHPKEIDDEIHKITL